MPEYFKIIDEDALAAIRNRCQEEISFLEEITLCIVKVVNCIDVGNMPRQIDRRFFEKVKTKYGGVALKIEKDSNSVRFLVVEAAKPSRNPHSASVESRHGWLNLQVDLKQKTDEFIAKRHALEAALESLETNVCFYNHHLGALHNLADSIKSPILRSQFPIFKNFHLGNG